MASQRHPIVVWGSGEASEEAYAARSERLGAVKVQPQVHILPRVSDVGEWVPTVEADRATWTSSDLDRKPKKPKRTPAAPSPTTTDAAAREAALVALRTASTELATKLLQPADAAHAARAAKAASAQASATSAARVPASLASATPPVPPAVLVLGGAGLLLILVAALMILRPRA